MPRPSWLLACGRDGAPPRPAPFPYRYLYYGAPGAVCQPQAGTAAPRPQGVIGKNSKRTERRNTMNAMTLKIVNAEGAVLQSCTGTGTLRLVYREAYRPGDCLVLDAGAPGRFAVVQ